MQINATSQPPMEQMQAAQAKRTEESAEVQKQEKTEKVEQKQQEEVKQDDKQVDAQAVETITKKDEENLKQVQSYQAIGKSKENAVYESAMSSSQFMA